MRGWLDLGGTKIQAVVTARGARVVGQARRSTPARGGPEALVRDLVGTMRDAAVTAGRGLSSFLGVFWGTGAGGGLVVDGRLLACRGLAGEIGHVCAKPGGCRCNCGLQGGAIGASLSTPAPSRE